MTTIAAKAPSSTNMIPARETIVSSPDVSIIDVIEQNTITGMNFTTALVIRMKILLNSSRMSHTIFASTTRAAVPVKIPRIINCSTSLCRNGAKKLAGTRFPSMYVNGTETPRDAWPDAITGVIPLPGWNTYTNAIPTTAAIICVMTNRLTNLLPTL